MSTDGNVPARLSDTVGRRRRLSAALASVFLFAMIMGPGPGVYLVNPDPHDPQSAFVFGTIPILYAWALFWFAVQASVVLIAFFFLWDTPVDRNREGSR